MRKTGRVWLVGAGPGDAGMLTLKGLEILKKAEVVVYDDTPGSGVLALIPQTARKIHISGKPADAERIAAALTEEAGNGYRVVRLISGDPCFGADSHKESVTLHDEGIPCEVVPGIGEAGVLENAGCPVFGQKALLTVIRYQGPADQKLKSASEMSARNGGNLLVLCKAGDAADIADELVKAGMDPDTPACVTVGGISADTRIAEGVLSSTADFVSAFTEEEKSEPAVFYAGGVRVKSDPLPLSGWRIAAAKARGRESAVSEKLRECGAEVLELPVWSAVQMKENDYFKDAAAHLDSFDWLLFASPAAAEMFLDKLIKCGIDLRRLSGLKIGCTGEWTARRLREKGIFADFVPSGNDPEAFVREFSERSSENERILFPRNGKESSELVRTLRERGNEVEALTISSIRLNKIDSIDLKKETAAGKIQCVLFTSVHAVKGFAESVKGADLSKLSAACIGAQTKLAAEACGMKAYLAEKETADGLIDLVLQIRSKM